MVSREALREALPQTWPMLPAWCIGAFRLIFTEGMWDPARGNPMNLGPDNTLGVQVLILAAIGSVAYLLAPRMGPYLLVVTSSSTSVPSSAYGSIGGDIGTSIIRILALFTLYLIVFVTP